MHLACRSRDVDSLRPPIGHRHDVSHEDERRHGRRHVLAQVPEIVGRSHRLGEVLSENCVVSACEVDVTVRLKGSD